VAERGQEHGLAERLSGLREGADTLEDLHGLTAQEPVADAVHLGVDALAEHWLSLPEPW
jgi:hypothetical protein